MEMKQHLLGKILYGTLFALILPLALWDWTVHIHTKLPSVQNSLAGSLALGFGILCMLAGIFHLWTMGKGLPMNAFPPAQVVQRGIYAWLPHPIYLGFTWMVLGISLFSGSATGLWITTPLVALGCVGLVVGFEGPSLQARFGKDHLPKPWLRIPSGTGEASLSERFGTAILVLVIWGLAYFGVKAFGIPLDAVQTRLALEAQIPLLPQSLPIYTSIYLIVPLAFLISRRKTDLRELAIGSLLATLLNTLAYLVIPFSAHFRIPMGSDWMSQWLGLEQQLASPAAGSFPSFHATWAVLVTFALTKRRSRPIQAVWILWCLALCLSCLTTGMHSLADIIAGCTVGFLFVKPSILWRHMLDATEQLGNSWKAFQIGSLRIMSHGVWSGLAGAVGLALAGAAAGQQIFTWGLVVALASLMGAGLWAQWVEGSSALLRPFGYYGAILGGLLALAIIQLVGGPGILMLGAFSLSAPFVQAIGRLRCVVQGCCHGKPVGWGIRITNPHSRVVKLAQFGGTPIHPTPLYSILGNLVGGAILLRMWLTGTAPFMIAGVYFIFAGFLRFMEEAYRGEPQTEAYLGLPLYQWMAIGSSLLGMLFMVVPQDIHRTLTIGSPSPMILLASASWGMVSAFAMSMDFPKSSRRFSRLTG